MRCQRHRGAGEVEPEIAHPEFLVLVGPPGPGKTMHMSQPAREDAITGDDKIALTTDPDDLGLFTAGTGRSGRQ